MAIPYSAGTAFTTPTCVRAWYEYPFRDQGDSVTKLYHHIMQVKETSYAPLADDDVLTDAGEKPERSPFADDAAAYYVGDSTPSHIGDGLVEFDRMFANIPADRVDPLGKYAANIPGVLHNATPTISAVWYATSTSKSFTNTPEPRITVTISATRIGNYEVGDTVQLFNANTWTVNGGSSSSTLRGVILSIATNTIVVNTLTFPTSTVVTTINSDNSATSYDIGLNLRDIDARTDNVAAFFDITYVKTSTPETETLGESLTIYDSSKNITTLADNNTTPTITEILNDMQDKVITQLEDTTIERWKGNIYAKVSIKGRLPLLNV